MSDFFRKESNGSFTKLLFMDASGCQGVREPDAITLVDKSVEAHNTSITMRDDSNPNIPVDQRPQVAVHPQKHTAWEPEVITAVTPGIAAVVEKNITDKLAKEELVPAERKGIYPPVLSLGDRILKGADNTFTLASHSDYGEIDYFVVEIPELGINEVVKATNNRATFTIPASATANLPIGS